MDTTKTGCSPFGRKPAHSTQVGYRSRYFQLPATSAAAIAEIRAENAFWNDAQDEWGEGWRSAKAPESDSVPAEPTVVITRRSAPQLPQPVSVDSADFWADAACEWSDDVSFSSSDLQINKRAA